MNNIIENYDCLRLDYKFVLYDTEIETLKTATPAELLQILTNDPENSGYRSHDLMVLRRSGDLIEALTMHPNLESFIPAYIDSLAAALTHLASYVGLGDTGDVLWEAVEIVTRARNPELANVTELSGPTLDEALILRSTIIDQAKFWDDNPTA